MSQQEDMKTIQEYLQQLGKLEASTDAWGLSVFQMASAGVMRCSEINAYNKSALATHNWVQQTFDKIHAAAKGTSAQKVTDHLPVRAKDPLMFGSFVANGLAMCQQSDVVRVDPKTIRMFGQLPGAPPCPEMAGSQGTQLGIAAVAAVPVAVGAIVAWTILAVAVSVGGSVLALNIAKAVNVGDITKAADTARVEAARALAAQRCWNAKNQFGKGTAAEYDRCVADAIAANPMTEFGAGFFASAGKFLLIAGGVAVAGIGTYYLAKHLYRSGEQRRQGADREATA